MLQAPQKITIQYVNYFTSLITSINDDYVLLNDEYIMLNHIKSLYTSTSTKTISDTYLGRIYIPNSISDIYLVRLAANSFSFVLLNICLGTVS